MRRVLATKEEVSLWGDLSARLGAARATFHAVEEGLQEAWRKYSRGANGLVYGPLIASTALIDARLAVQSVVKAVKSYEKVAVHRVWVCL